MPNLVGLLGFGFFRLNLVFLKLQLDGFVGFVGFQLLECPLLDTVEIS